MCTLRPFTCQDLFKFNRVNFDPLTETYGTSFYLQVCNRHKVYSLTNRSSKTKQHRFRDKPKVLMTFVPARDIFFNESTTENVFQHFLYMLVLLLLRARANIVSVLLDSSTNAACDPWLIILMYFSIWPTGLSTALWLKVHLETLWAMYSARWVCD